MELEHSFTVPVPLDRAWDVLLDVERVAPCMPGASLDSVNGDEIKGRIKVKVGPISMTYAGTARFTERDAAARVMKLEASGKETRGAGTASATVRSELHGEGDETRVIVHTSLNVTGKPAQFGRGVMAEVGGKLIGIFAANLAKMLTADNAAGSPAQAGAAAEAGAANAAASQAAGAGTEAAGAGSEDELALPVEELHLALRSHNSLRRDGIHTVGELASRTEQQLLAIDHIGPASVEEIRQKLAERGLSLRDGADAAAAGRTAASRTGTDGSPVAAAAGTPAAGTGVSGHTAASKAAANGDSGQPAPAPGPRPVPADARPPDDDAIDLLSVAGLPVLKRALPVLAGVVVAVAVVLRFRFRRRRAAR
jgi:carbon monoxide dehydrogenase subunit G